MGHPCTQLSFKNACMCVAHKISNTLPLFKLLVLLNNLIWLVPGKETEISFQWRPGDQVWAWHASLTSLPEPPGSASPALLRVSANCVLPCRQHTRAGAEALWSCDTQCHLFLSVWGPEWGMRAWRFSFEKQKQRRNTERASETNACCPQSASKMFL